MKDNLYYHPLKQLLFSCRVTDCSDHVISMFTGSDVFEIQALSAMLLAKLLSSDPRVLTNQGERILDAISTTLTRLPQVNSVNNGIALNVR